MSDDYLEDFYYRPDMRVIRSARNFIQSLSEVYGPDRGLKVWDYIRKGLGEQIACDIFHGLLIGMGDVEVISIGSLRIEAIREVRAFTSMSLREAKEFIEAVTPSNSMTIKCDGKDPAEVNKFCENMRTIGCVVK